MMITRAIGGKLLVRNLQKAEPECSGDKNGIQSMTLFFRMPPRKTFAHNCARTHNHRIDKSFLIFVTAQSQIKIVFGAACSIPADRECLDPNRTNEQIDRTSEIFLGT